MKAGIIEYTNSHFTLVNTLARIHLSSPDDEVVVFITEKGYQNLVYLTGEYGDRISFEILDVKVPFSQLLDKVSRQELDIAYFTTLTKYLKLLSRKKFSFPLTLFIHNTDLWLPASILSRIFRFLGSIRLSWNGILSSPYYFKNLIVYPSPRRKLIKAVLGSDWKFAVLNDMLKSQLIHHIPPHKIQVIPFCVYDAARKYKSPDNKRLRLCIPGKTSLVRRDYLSFFEMLDKDSGFFTDHLEIDVLGNVSMDKEEKSDIILERAVQLEKKGFHIYYYRDFIPFDRFDELLDMADVLLVPIHIKLKNKSVYGKTKDTGAVYNMISAAKPGLLPAGFQVMDGLRSSSITYDSFEHLGDILRNMIQHPDELDRYREQATMNALAFTAEIIYKRIYSRDDAPGEA